MENTVQLLVSEVNNLFNSIFLLLVIQLLSVRFLTGNLFLSHFLKDGSTEGTVNHDEENHNDGSGSHASDSGHHGGIHIFTAEFARVQTPFIISLWIICASLAKIGESIFLLFNITSYI